MGVHGTAWVCKNNYTLSIFYHHGLISWPSNLETAKSHNQSSISSKKKNHSNGFPMVLYIENAVFYSESAVCKVTDKSKNEYSIWTYFLLKLWRRQGENLGANQMKPCESWHLPRAYVHQSKPLQPETQAISGISHQPLWPPAVFSLAGRPLFALKCSRPARCEPALKYQLLTVLQHLGIITAANCKDYSPVCSALLVLLHRFCIAACCYPVVLGLPSQPVWPCPLSCCAPTPQGTLALLLHCDKTSDRRSATENNQLFTFYFVFSF